MLRTRVMPCILLKNGRLVKTVKFQNDKYVGDLLNAVRIYNQKEVDELVVFDISRTTSGQLIDFDLIQKMAAQCFMPVCYGGGVKTLNDFKTLFTLGVEKVSVSSLLFDNPEVVRDAVSIYGSQSIVATIDLVKPLFRSRYVIKTHSGRKKRAVLTSEIIAYCEDLGVGEIILTSIDHEGQGKGYDYELVKQISHSVNIPVVISGGAGQLDDFKKAVDSGASAVAAGDMFTFYGKHRAVLITYPEYEQLTNLFKGS